jgi:energy-coupling factor transporter ATP-binding protein EcfA2
VPNPWTALGYDHTASDIASALSESADIVVIEGPPGVGKSWLAKHIGGMWDSGGGVTVVAEGDPLKSEEPFYPFRFAMSELPVGWKSMLSSAADLAKLGETTLGTAGVITATVKTLAGIRGKQRRQGSIYLGDVGQEALFEMEKLGKKGPILFIADNLHWWDADSLHLLDQLRGERMASMHPFLTEMRVLALQTPEPYQSVAQPEAHEILLKPGRTRAFCLDKVPREGFENVLEALGAPSAPSAAVADTIYRLSGGHLALVSRCAKRLDGAEEHDLFAARDIDEFTRVLLTERMAALGTRGKHALAVLRIAAILGLTFRREELTCAAVTDEPETVELLRYCRDEDVLELSKGVGSFVHELYRQYFLQTTAHDKIAVHERLADCLRLLRPSEYVIRCKNAVAAEQERQAAALGVHAALQEVREGRDWQDLPQATVEVIQEGGLTGVVETFVLASERLGVYRQAECHNALDSLPRDLPKSLLAEADYLRAMCLMSTRSEEDRGTGRAILESWVGYEEQEPEIGIRLLQLLLYGMTHLPDKEPGRNLEGRIRHVLGERTAFDRAAKDAIYVLDRCSASLYQPDIAVIRTREAVAYFAAGDEQTVLLRPLEYYRCLVNHGANLIATAQYEKARDVYDTLARLVDEYSQDVFPRLDFPHTNSLLADYRLESTTAQEAVVRQRDIATNHRVESDPFYVDNALAVYLSLSGEQQEAISILDGLDSLLSESRSIPEPSMTYLIRSNRCAARFLAGDFDRAVEEWDALDGVVEKIAYVFRPLMLRRHELLAKIMGRREPMSPVAFDTCLIADGSREYGPLWKNFGRGFRMPEVEFWRDS